MYMATAKQATTIATQAALAALDLAVEMCTRPWIVELSKNSRIDAVAIFMKKMSVLVKILVKAWVTNVPPSVCVTQGKLGTRNQCQVDGVVKIDPWGQTVQTFECKVGGVAKTGGKLIRRVNFPLASKGQQQISIGIKTLPQTSRRYDHFKLPVWLIQIPPPPPPGPKFQLAALWARFGPIVTA